MSGCVYESVLVGSNDKKLEFRLEKSFSPRNGQEITVIDADGNASILHLTDLQFLAFVNTPSQINYNFSYSGFKV